MTDRQSGSDQDSQLVTPENLTQVIEPGVQPSDLLTMLHRATADFQKQSDHFTPCEDQHAL